MNTLMRKGTNGMILCICLLAWGAGECAKTKSIAGTRGQGYRLVWADEFNKSGAVDTMNWRFEKGFVRNEEAQWYKTENATCKAGILVIEGRREQRPNAGFVQRSSDWRKERAQIEYTSSSINTRGKQSWLYGRFVMRGRIDISLLQNQEAMGYGRLTVK